MMMPRNELTPSMPVVTEPGEGERRHALLFMLEDLEESRRKIEQARREWTQAFDAIRDPVFVHDVKYRVIRANRAYADHAGSDFASIIGRPYWEVFPRGSGPLPHCQIATEDQQDSVTDEFTLDSGEIFVSRSFVIRDTERRFLYAVHVLEDVSEHRRAESEIRLLSEALRQLVAGVILLNSDMTFRYANPAACKLVGYEPGQLDGKPIATVVPENMRERMPVVQTAVDATGHWTGEVMLAARDGTAIPLYLSASTIVDAEGKRLAYAGNWLDLRPIKQAQEALAASEARFRLLTENASDLVAVVEADGHLLYISPSVQRLLGYTPDEVAGRSMFDFLPPEDVAIVQAKIAQSLADPSSVQSLAHRLRHKDGNWRPFETLGRNLLHEPSVGGFVLNLRDITERNQAESALRDEKFFSDQAIESLPGMFYLVDANSRFVRWNRNSETVTGYSHEEFEHLQVADLFASEGEKKYVAERVAEVFAKGESTAEVALFTKDGRRIPYFFTGRRVELQGGTYLIGVGLDISARAQAEEALRVSRDLLSSIVENVPIRVFWKDRELHYLGGNTLFARDAGKSRPEELLGKDDFQMGWRDQAELYRADDKQVMDSDRPKLGFEEPQTAPDGRTMWLRTSKVPLHDATGKVFGVLGIYDDITERKQMEEALRLSAERYRGIVESQDDLIVRVDTEGRFTFVNDAYCKKYGVRREEMIGQKTFKPLVHPDDLPAALEAMKGLQYPPYRIRVEQRTLATEGIRWVQWEDYAIRDEQGNIVEIQGVGRDVTDSKQAEQALHRANRALKTLSACNAALVHAVDETQLLHDMCNAVVEEGGYRFAWVGYAEPDSAKRIRPVVQSGVEEGYLETLQLTWADTERGRGPGGQAVRSGQPAVVRNILTDPNFAPWREEALKRGYASNIALPLKVNDDVFGVLSIFAAEDDAFDEQEVALLAELAEDSGFGILTLRTRAEHQRLQEEHLKTSEQLKETLTDTIRAIALTVEMRDPYTAGHQQRVAEICVAIGREMGFADDRLEGLRLGATIHDIGKIHVPAEILARPGKLSHAEFEIIQSHSEVGFEIVKGVKFPWPVAEMILQHHERLDGSGYPRGLKGEEIILEARILAVADTVEAMSTHRPYRPALSHEAAMDEIKTNRGLLYDPAVVDACLRVFEAHGESWWQIVSESPGRHQG